MKKLLFFAVGMLFFTGQQSVASLASFGTQDYMDTIACGCARQGLCSGCCGTCPSASYSCDGRVFGLRGPSLLKPNCSFIGGVVGDKVSFTRLPNPQNLGTIKDKQEVLIHQPNIGQKALLTFQLQEAQDADMNNKKIELLIVGKDFTQELANKEGKADAFKAGVNQELLVFYRRVPGFRETKWTEVYSLVIDNPSEKAKLPLEFNPDGLVRAAHGVVRATQEPIIGEMKLGIKKIG